MILNGFECFINLNSIYALNLNFQIYKKIIKYFLKNFFPYIKMSTRYQKSKEQLEADACKKYQNLSEEKKSKKCQ